MLEGGRGKSRPLTPDLPAPASPLVPPPGLGKAERAAWTKHVGWLRALALESSVDAGMLEGMVVHYCRARAADAVIRRKGPVVLTKLNGPIKRPEVAISADSWRAYNQLASQFGMSPAARAKLGGGAGKEERAGDLPAELSDAAGGRT